MNAVEHSSETLERLNGAAGIMLEAMTTVRAQLEGGPVRELVDDRFINAVSATAETLDALSVELAQIAARLLIERDRIINED